MLIKKKVKKVKISFRVPKKIAQRISELKKRANELDAEFPIEDEVVNFLEKILSRAEKEIEKIEREVSGRNEKKFSFISDAENEDKHTQEEVV